MDTEIYSYPLYMLMGGRVDQLGPSAYMVELDSHRSQTYKSELSDNFMTLRAKVVACFC